MRDIIRKINLREDTAFALLVSQAKRLLIQEKTTANKLYSLHAPEVECIAKGKAHKRYEFGCKVSVVTTCKDPWALSTMAHHDDGATLKECIKKPKITPKARLTLLLQIKVIKVKIIKRQIWC